MSQEYLFVEKYRPRKIDDTILPVHISKLFENVKKEGQIQNLILAGVQGSGKTTVAQALCSEMGFDFITINGSEENGIDVLRNKIKDFASKISVFGAQNHKVVIIEESDYLSCLEENENIVLADGSLMKLSNFEPDKEYQVLSFNQNTHLFEEDTASLVYSKFDEVFEIEFETGEKIKVTGDHPFLVLDEQNNIVEMTLADVNFDISKMQFIFQK